MEEIELATFAWAIVAWWLGSKSYAATLLNAAEFHFELLFAITAHTALNVAW